MPIAVFAASLVRFTFIALTGSLCLAIILADAKQRKHIAGVALVVLIAMISGLIARSNSYSGRISEKYAMEGLTGEGRLAKAESASRPELQRIGNDGEDGRADADQDPTIGNLQHSRESYAIQLRALPGAVDCRLDSDRDRCVGLDADAAVSRQMQLMKLPSCSLAVDLDDSIAMRKILFRDALFLIPSAGWIGLGLDSFMKLSCIKQTEVHNSILQAVVEFGWLAALLLFLLIVLIGSSMLVAARHDGASRFVLCSLAFIVLMSLAHGRISRDAVVFAFLGCAVGVKETPQRLVARAD